MIQDNSSEGFNPKELAINFLAETRELANGPKCGIFSGVKRFGDLKKLHADCRLFFGDINSTLTKEEFDKISKKISIGSESV